MFDTDEALTTDATTEPFVPQLLSALKRDDFRTVYEMLKAVKYLTGVPRRLFDAFPVCPVQRDTDARAKLWMRQRDPNFAENHEDVSVAVLPDRAMKIDGHTRGLLWSNGSLPLPPGDRINIRVFHPETMEKAIQIYDYCDNPATMLKAADITRGVERLTGITLKSNYLRGGNVKSLQIARAILGGNFEEADSRVSILDKPQRSDDQARLMQIKRFFHPVLAQIDRYNPSGKEFQAQILAACILAVVVDGPERALGTFFGPYLDPSCHRQDGYSRNAIKMLHDERSDVKGTFYHYNGSQLMDNLLRVLRYYEEHLYRTEFGHSQMIEPRIGRTGKPSSKSDFIKPGIGKTHKTVDLKRYAIGLEEATRRIQALA